jgi:hypothetical protein
MLYTFSLHQESPDRSWGDEPLVSKVVMSQNDNRLILEEKHTSKYFFSRWNVLNNGVGGMANPR